MRTAWFTDRKWIRLAGSLVLAVVWSAATSAGARGFQSPSPGEQPLPREPADPVPGPGAIPPADPPRSVGAPLLAPPTAEVVRGRLTAWLAQRGAVDPELVERVARDWADGDTQPAAEQLFDRTLRTFADADGEVREFIAACGLTSPPLVPPEPRLLRRAVDGEFFTANLGLFYGKYLVHRQMFDEALGLLEELPAAEVIDPAGLLFAKAVCQHHLLLKEQGLATIQQLLRNTTGVPMRYATLAALMQYDLESLQDKSLDEVAKRMFDVERRLSLARTGEGVQKREEEIITSLDEIIKKIEEQQGGGGGSGGNTNRSSAPAQDSVVKGSTAPGQVDPKKFKNTGDWGDLPPKERTKAKEDIARKFGAHYAEAVEKFNLKQAARPARKGK